MFKDVSNVVNASTLNILKNVVKSNDTLSDAQLGKVLRNVLQKAEEEAQRQQEEAQRQQEEEAKRWQEEFKRSMHYLAIEEDRHVKSIKKIYGDDIEPVLQEYLIKDENNSMLINL
tara:strand:- start:864 stop:1211 length:348 start_codon:yes stop_codon:yes gene_type:complete